MEHIESCNLSPSFRSEIDRRLTQGVCDVRHIEDRVLFSQIGGTPMFRTLPALFYTLLVLLLSLLVIGCEEETAFVDPYPPSGLRPEITSITPERIEQGTHVTITGKNFNSDPEKNMVVIGSNVVIPTSASDQVIELTAPAGIGGSEPETTSVRVVVQNSEYVSAEFMVVIAPWILEFSSPRGVAVDSGGNLYVNDSDDWTVYKVPADGGDTEVYTEMGGNGDIVFDAAGNLYICSGGDWGSEIWVVPPGGGDAELFSDNEDLSPFDLDFGADGSIFVGGRWAGLHRIAPDGTITTLLESDEIENPLSVRVFDEYLYWSNNDNNSIERAHITGNDLGTVEVVFEDPDGEYIDDPFGIDIDVEGNIYVVCKGWGGNQNLTRIMPDGTAEVLLELPGDNNRHIALGNGFVYVASVGGGVVYKVFLGIDAAPVF